MTRRCRVLHLLKGLGPGGAEHLVVGHVALGDRDAFDYSVAYLLPWKDALVAPARAAGAEVTCLDAPRAADPRWARRLRHLVRDSSIDLVHVHSPYVAGIARLALHPMSRRPRIAYTLHNRIDSFRRSTRAFDVATMPLDDLDLAVSANVRASLPARRQERFEVVRHGVDLAALDAVRDRRSAVRVALGLAPDAVVVCTVANLRHQKDHPTLLTAAAQVLARSPRVRFLVVGQGPLEAEVDALHDRLGLGDRVRLLGQRDDVPDLLAAADVFALSSRFEGLPVALMEALALGLPVVATDVGGIPEAVTDGVEGILVPPGQPDRLAAALLELVGDAARRRTMAAAAAARGRGFDLRVAVATIEDRYRALVVPDG
jgi:glycosyltransferase involved in cell wall biosynthesis